MDTTSEDNDYKIIWPAIALAVLYFAAGAWGFEQGKEYSKHKNALKAERVINTE